MIKAKAIKKLSPDAEFVVRGDEIEWISQEITQPTESEIQAKIEELQAAEPMRLLRLERDQRLSATDWWCVSDRTPTQVQLDYRQALRDLPANSTPALDENGQLTGVEWPVKPA